MSLSLARRAAALAASLSLARRAAALAASVTLALVVIGCGSDDDPSAAGTESATGSPADAPTEEPTEELTAEPTEPPSTPSETPAPPPDPAGGSPETTAAAIARFETFLHALGAGDVPTMCAIAGPAAAQAEADGFGPCEATMAMMAGMPSAEQSAALQTATVDPELVDDSTPGQVIVPVEAIVADATFTADELGDAVLAYQDGDWFIVD
ncbi:hypothetical protein E1212_08805 [Jiangella ureilytica]|uniref:Uncharacterized protein n=1 Tax=Jiangella ureilytica TaxID=2530374 RepID=A0A4R4RR56_9ACTN|nr:hypothetical protein [Jiangella ureilytica]TDC52408.1 hypothetical protein E1212_08805 [Jiangella ureilytica]